MNANTLGLDQDCNQFVIQTGTIEIKVRNLVKNLTVKANPNQDISNRIGYWYEGLNREVSIFEERRD